MKSLKEFINEVVMTSHKRSWVAYKEGYPVLYKKILEGSIQVIHEHEFEELCDWLIEMDIEDLMWSVVERFVEIILQKVDPQFTKTSIDGIPVQIARLVNLRGTFNMTKDDKLLYKPETSYILAIFNKLVFLKAQKDLEKKSAPAENIDKVFNEVKIKLSNYSGFNVKNPEVYDRVWPDLSKSFKKLSDHFR